MSAQQVAGENARDLSPFIQADVEQEGGTPPQGDIAQLLPEGIAFCDAKRRARVANVFGAVIAHDGWKTGATGHDPFWPAAEAGEKMGFDETSDDANIRLHQVPIDQRRRAIAGRAELNQGIGILRLMIEHPI